MTERRITVEEVIAAYRSLGLGTLTCNWVQLQNGEWCGCPMSAVVLAERPDTRRKGVWIRKEACEIFGDNYVNGFVVAVDGQPTIRGEQRFREGYEDGVKVRNEAFRGVWRERGMLT